MVTEEQRDRISKLHTEIQTFLNSAYHTIFNTTNYAKGSVLMNVVSAKTGEMSDILKDISNKQRELEEKEEKTAHIEEDIVEVIEDTTKIEDK